jgi:hypothetical protein
VLNLGDWNHALQTNPTVYIHSSDATNVAQYLSLTHNQSDSLISSGVGSIVFSDAYKAGSTWSGPGIKLFASSQEWSDIESLITSEGSIAAAILKASQGSGSASLAATAVGYGSVGNALTGDATNFHWNAIFKQLFIGPGTPDYFTTTNYSVYINGTLEIDGFSYFDGSASFNSSVTFNSSSTINGSMTFYSSPILRDGTALYFGNSSDSALFHSAINTPDTLVLGLGSESNGIVVCEKTDITTDWAHALQTNPTLWIQSATTTSAQYISLTHNQSNAFISSGTGSIWFADAYKSGSTWLSAGIGLFASTAEWTSIETLIGSEGSIAGAILAAGGTANLAATAIGYGDGATPSKLTGNATYFKYNTNRQVLIGSGSPAEIGTTNDSVYIGGKLEVVGATHISGLLNADGSLQLESDKYLYLGSSTGSTDPKFVYATANTPDTLVLGLGTTSRGFVICEASDIATDWSHSQQTNPTLFVQSSASATPGQYIALTHNQTDAFVSSGVGSVAFSDSYRSGSTWASAGGIKLFASSAEWSSIETLIGSEGSIAAAIIAASTHTNAITKGYVTYGNSGGTGITGTSIFFYDAANERLGVGLNAPLSGVHIGAGTQDKIANNQNGLYVTGNAEIDGSSYFDGAVYVASATDLNIGSSKLRYSTAQTNDSLVIGLNSARRLIVCDDSDVDFNFAHTNASHPSFVIHSAAQSTSEFIAMANVGTYSEFYCGAGGISFRPNALSANNVSGQSVAFGGGNTVSGGGSIVSGDSNTVQGAYVNCTGSSNTDTDTSSTFALVMGASNTYSDSDYSFVLGSDNTISNQYCIDRGKYVASWWNGTNHFCGGKAYTSDSAGSAQAMDGLCISARTTNTTITNLLYNGSTPFYVPLGHVAFVRMHIMSSCSGDTTGVYAWNVRDVYLCMWYTSTACASRIISDTEIANFGTGTPISTTVYIPTDDNAGTFTMRIQCTVPNNLAVYHVGHIYSAIITKAALGVSS